MVIGEVIERVEKSIDKGPTDINKIFSRRHIYNKMLSVRSLLLSQEVGKKQKVSDWNYDILHKIELIQVPTHEVPGLPSAGCKVLKSKFKIPKVVRSLEGDTIRAVQSIDRTSFEIDRVPTSGLDSIKGNKYSKDFARYIIEDEYLYIFTSLNIKYVRMVALFEDSIKVEDFNSGGESKNCKFYPEIEFKLDSSKIDTLVELVLKELFIGNIKQTENAEG